METSKNVSTGIVNSFKIPVGTVKPFEELPDGEYVATLKEIELNVMIPDKSGGFFDSLKWKFDIGKPYCVTGKSSTNLNCMSKAYAWVRELTGKELSPEDEFSPSMVIGKKCKIVVKNRLVPRTDGTNAKFPNVINVKAISS